VVASKACLDPGNQRAWRQRIVQTAAVTSGPPAASDFYTGLVAELYRYLRAETFDPEPYARFVERSGQPALELGCGDGDPLLDLRARGLEVEGLDSSLDMLDRCRAAASDRGLDVTLHHATFEGMKLDRRFGSIYFAGATFNLLPDDETAHAALGRIAEHLRPGGSALVPLFVPLSPSESDVGQVREHVTDDGVVMRVTVVDIVRDEATRVQTTALRYERRHGTDHEVVDRSWKLHWFEQDRFAAMAADAGLVTRSVHQADGSPATTHDTAFTFILGRPEA
jgi:SAM-dependent methyltransferase